MIAAVPAQAGLAAPAGLAPREPTDTRATVTTNLRVCIPSPLDSEPRLSPSVTGVLPTVCRVETRVKAAAGTADRRSRVVRVAALAVAR